eukprot:5164637-Amphidinium_carterae.1
MLYLQLPKEGARHAGERRPIALLPQVYRLWCALCRHDVRAWRARCTGRGEVPVGRGALDETFDLAFDTEQKTAAGKPQAGVFLDCSKCYERIPLCKLEKFALESGYPLYALYAALDMYAGRRRVLLQGAVSEPVTATHGMPPGCGHAVDLLHAFLLKTLQSAGRHVSVRKYVDDMVLIASGPCFAGHLCYGYRQVLKSLTAANMKVNLKKTLVICNGANAKRLLKKVWRAGRLPPLRVTTRDLGVDTQWAAWRCPVQRKRVITFKQSMTRVRSLGLPAPTKARIAKSLYSVGLYGAEVGAPVKLLERVRICGVPAPWSFVAEKRPDFRGLETALSTQSYRHLKKSANRTEDSFRSAFNASLGGVWHEVRTDSAFHVGALCVRCKEEPEDLSHIVFRCPHWHRERRDVELPADNDAVPPCVKLHGLLPAPRVPAIRHFEPALVYREGVTTVWTDGSGRHSSDPHHRRCGVGYHTDTQ